MALLYGVELDVSTRRIQLDLKLYIANKGGLNISNLHRVF